MISPTQEVSMIAQTESIHKTVYMACIEKLVEITSPPHEFSMPISRQELEEYSKRLDKIGRIISVAERAMIEESIR
jgi:hypothetical protein